MLELKARARGIDETVDASTILGNGIISTEGERIETTSTRHLDSHTFLLEGMKVRSHARKDAGGPITPRQYRGRTQKKEGWWE